jgi:hypothetical protein
MKPLNVIVAGAALASLATLSACRRRMDFPDGPAVSAGSSHGLAIAKDGGLWMRGHKTYSQHRFHHYL